MTPERERFSLPLSHVFAFVHHEVIGLGHSCVEPEHLLLGLIQEKEGNAFDLLNEMQIDLPALEEDIHQILSEIQAEKSCDRLTMSEATKHMLDLSMESRGILNRSYLGTEHLLVGMMWDLNGRSYSLLRRRGVSYNQLLDAIQSMPVEPLAQDREISRLSLKVPCVPAETLTFGEILRRISPTFWGLLAGTVLSGLAAYFQWFRADLAVFLFVTLGWIVSVCLHEFGHAVVAYLGGDQAVLQRGYLTLNPLRYTHGFMSIVLPILVLLLGGIGLPGGAVFINLGAIRSNKIRSLVAAAGPLMTGAVLLVLGLMLSFLPMVVNFSQHSEFFGGLSFLVFIQIWALIFNLFPIPGFDGFGIVMPFLPPALAQRMYQASTFILFIFITLYLWDTPVQRFFWQIVNGVMAVLRVDPHLIFYGLDLYRFW